ncbi:putative phosphatase/phosphohexomutase [Mycolicibacterium cosmeticum]|uniref:Phosphatase/phosphohexomutase n=2 Tax=Mycolicibacterium cosmeticum TaxID=258533 RepID=W9B4V7_MYCCO|nr:putative phosphatase/phosphohexomutase [Mycolicibacterium cosmeticum]
MTWATLSGMRGDTPVRCFWWDAGRPAGAVVEELRAVIFDVDGALGDIERDGQRRAFNAAFAEHGFDISWSVAEYGRLVRIGDERRRIASALRRRGYGRISPEIASYIQHTKNDIFVEWVLDGDVTPRAGLVDLANRLYAAGISIAAISAGSPVWVEPLVRQLIGEGIAEVIVTPDDLSPAREPDLHGHALWELGIGAECALAVTGSAHGLRAATAAKLATVVVPTAYTAGQDFTGAAAVRADYAGWTVDGCVRQHRHWWMCR